MADTELRPTLGFMAKLLVPAMSQLGAYNANTLDKPLLKSQAVVNSAEFRRLGLPLIHPHHVRC